MMKKYIAEVWVLCDKDMKDDEILTGIRDAYNEYWGSTGHFKTVRICNIKKKAGAP